MERGQCVRCHLLPGVSAGSSAKAQGHNMSSPPPNLDRQPLLSDSPGLKAREAKGENTGAPATPVRSLLDGESEKGSPASCCCCCRHPAPHQTSDTFHFLRNKACLRDEVTHTAASGTGARRMGGQANGVHSLFCWPMPVWGGQSQSLPAPPSSTMKHAFKGLGSEEDPLGPTGRGWCLSLL